MSEPVISDDIFVAADEHLAKLTADGPLPVPPHFVGVARSVEETRRMSVAEWARKLVVGFNACREIVLRGGK